MKEFKIGNVSIGTEYPPFIIAEMSGNHNRSLDTALSIIDAAAATGVHAIKLQTYTADSLTIDVAKNEFVITDSKSLWQGRNLYSLYQEACTPYEWHKALFERAEQKSILCFSTPFDEEGVDFLERLNAPAYKIASFENNHFPLLKKVAKTGKPVIMSTGISTVSDIADAVETLRVNGCKDLVLLKCTSTYPAIASNSNLLTIPHMAALFNCHVGLSDHTMGIGVAIAAVALGARVIEKHFTLRRSDGGVDSAFSLEPAEFEMLVSETEKAFLSLGTVQYGIQEAERNSKIFKRSIYIVEDMKAGDFFSESNIRIIRPGLGLSPKLFDTIMGKRVTQDVSRGTALSFDLIG